MRRAMHKVQKLGYYAIIVGRSSLLYVHVVVGNEGM